MTITINSTSFSGDIINYCSTVSITTNIIYSTVLWDYIVNYYSNEKYDHKNLYSGLLRLYSKLIQGDVNFGGKFLKYLGFIQ